MRRPSRGAVLLTVFALILAGLLGSVLYLSGQDEQQRDKARENARFAARDRAALAQTVDLLRRQLLRVGVTPAAPPAAAIVEGLPGPPGPAGAVGAPGLDGLPGASIVGPRGLPGIDGKDGAAGEAGLSGVDGKDGTGTDGKDGAAGNPGSIGPAGADSTIAGPTGPTGLTGATGPAPASFTFQVGLVTYTCSDPDLDGAYTCTSTGPPA